MLLDLVDVFGARRLGGNPVAVVRDAHALDDAAMIALTRWLGYTQVAFVVPPTDPAADLGLRFFYPDGELPFGGHPALAAAAAWLADGHTPAWPGTVVLQCATGLIDVRIDGDGGRLAYQAPPLIRSGPLSSEERAESVRLTNINISAVVDAVHVVNKLPWRLLRLRSAADVLMADANARVPFVRANIGLLGPWAEGDPAADGAQWELRGLFANEGRVLLEDRVTSSLSAAVARYLYHKGLEQGDFMIAQGRRVGAAGRTTISRADSDEDGADGGTRAIWISGAVAMVACGAALIPRYAAGQPTESISVPAV